MRHRYFALIDHFARPRIDTRYPFIGALRELGMRLRGRMGRVALFTTEGTPVFSLPGDALIVGDLYCRDGRSITDPDQLEPFPSQRAFREHLLEHYWGEYLLIQPGDQERDHISIMRDPSSGIACAYSVQDGEGFITSDLAIPSQLGLHHDRVDWDFIDHCLIYPRAKINRTGLEGVCELLPGCMLLIEGQAISISQAWSPWNFIAPSKRLSDPVEATCILRETITKVVKSMAETDRSLLLELSGGLDSSIVGACLAQAQAQIACCTAITPLPGADERRYARLIADQLGAELLQRPLDFNEADISFPLPQHSLRPAVWVLGHAVSRVMDEAAALQDVRSHFSGSGGDTVFGYLSTAAPAADAFRAHGIAAGVHAVADLSKLHGCTMLKAARLTCRKLFLPPKPPCKADTSLLAHTGISAPLELHPWLEAPDEALPGDRERIFDLCGNQLFADATLRAGERRVRMPLLSQPVMEVCLRVPSWMWIADGKNRAIARSAFAGQLHHDVLNRRSKGTFMNYTYSVYERNKEMIRHFLLDGHLQAHGLLNPTMLNRFLDTPPDSPRSLLHAHL